MSMWIWIEHEVVQSYAFLIACYNDESEYSDFLNTIWKLRMEGNTEDKPSQSGFGLASTGLLGS